MAKLVLNLLITYGTFFFTEGFLFKHGFSHISNETSGYHNKTEVKYITLPVDHFNTNDNRTWSMMYLQRLDLWKMGSPICLLINGETPLTNDQYLYTGTFFEMARTIRCAMYYVEHRYYGSSKPLPDSSPESLKYLNSTQALADFVTLLKQVRKEIKYENSKIIVVGGSYAGNLAAWLRERYPYVVDVAYVSSAPIMAKANFFEYFEHVGKVLLQYGNQYCFDKVRNEFAEYERLMATPDGITYLKRVYGICESSDLTRWENKQLFYLRLITAYQKKIQYGTPEDIQKLCLDPKHSAQSLLSDELKEIMYDDDYQCLDINYDNLVIYLRTNVNYWMYQSCTEFGYFQTTESMKQPFPVNALSLKFYQKLCQDVFGIQSDFTEYSINATNNRYGGRDFQGTNVVFVYGSMDPWQELGYAHSEDSENFLLEISNVSHCDDMVSRPNDSSKKIVAKEMLQAWLLKKINILLI